MKLLIVESPAKAKTITKYLENKYTVKASVGHIRDLPKSSKKAIDIEAGFIPYYEISPGKESVVSELKKLANKADEIILATDPDREGEAIAWHLAEALELNTKQNKKNKSQNSRLKTIKRVTYHEITEKAIKEALKHPRDVDMDLVNAQQARRVLDRLFGYGLSGLIWKKVRYGLSAGRVQSPALRILMEREREIRAFIPETFWTITADFKNSFQQNSENSTEKITLTCAEEPRDKKEVDRILKIGKKEKWSVTGIKETEQKRAPRVPFITSTLQQTASTRLGFAPSRTMSIAQKLYEAGLITYMRTDSPSLSKDAQTQIFAFAKKEYGEEYGELREFKSKRKNAQEAHEAIRPSDVSKTNAGLSDDQKKLYRLIWQRTVASQMADANLLKTKITANVATSLSEEIPDFTINGSRTIFDGWFKADPEAKGEDVELPKLQIGNKLELIEIKPEEKETQPPSRYTEAGLIKELEKRGLGRPSTYATIINTIVNRGYVEKQGKTLFPTDTGDVVSSFLEKNFAHYISDSFTSKMEDDLDEIAEGKRKYSKTMKDFYEPFTKDVKSKANIDKITNLGDADPNIKCPVCGESMIIKLGKAGKFLSCSKFPDCVGARTIDGEELEGPKETGEDCPKCSNKLIERDGRFGRFVACSNYPKCKFIKQSEGEEKKKKTGVKCPKCKDGEMAERRGRFGIFYSCSNYPDCKYAIKAKPTGKLCDYEQENGELCGELMMEGTKTIPERCSNKNCPNHNPHKLKS